MKEKDLKAEANKQTFVMYAEKEDGSYGAIETGSYLIENDLDDFWGKMEHLERQMREKLLKAEISPVQYYMVIEGLTPAELAKRAALPPSKVRKHLTMKGFESARIRELSKYSRVFNIPVANLFQIVISSAGKNIKYHFYNKEDNRKETLTVTQNECQNPFIIITKAEEIKA